MTADTGRRYHVAVTGCCGFIGRSVTRQFLNAGHLVYGVDALTYAADPSFPGRMKNAHGNRFDFVARDIRELGRWPDVDAIIHLAAETHVDNSIIEPSRFVDVNVAGTHHLLEMTVQKRQHGMPLFVHISTDEVYGPMGPHEAATEEAPLKPSSPYAAAKAAGDLLVQAYGTTYGLSYAIIRPTNCYGIGQHPEKLIPKAIRSLWLGRPIPVHGSGLQTRQWLWVEDCASAILAVFLRVIGVPAGYHSDIVVNINGNSEHSVNTVVEHIVRCVLGDAEPTEHWVKPGYVRPGMDRRYAVDDWLLRRPSGFGWEGKGAFLRDLPKIVQAELAALGGNIKFPQGNHPDTPLG